MKMPALQFYPADWRKDPAVQSLNYHDRGVWFEMLCLMHESSARGVLLLNGMPMPGEALARILGLDNQTLNQTLTILLTYGVAKKRHEDGAVYSKRMVSDERLCEIRRKAGKLGGNPLLLNQNPTTGVKQVPTPSSSSSSSELKDVGRILDHLNQKTGRNYRPVKTNLSLIAARLKEGATPAECMAVIDAKVSAWTNDSKMSPYLRPATLFGAEKFAQYVGELATGVPPTGGVQWE